MEPSGERPEGEGQSSNTDLLAMRRRLAPLGISTANPPVIASASGSTWTDVDGDVDSMRVLHAMIDIEACRSRLG